MENINITIAKIEKYGFKVRERANMWKGKLVEDCPVVYEIYDAKTHQTLYGAGAVGPESLEKWLSWMVERYGEKADAESKAAEPKNVSVKPIMADVEKECEYDRIYNEGGEGYNPYRIGAEPTYSAKMTHAAPIDPVD